MKPILHFLIWLWGFALFAKDASPIHYVKKGDTLSQIAYKHFGSPIYSDDGSLNKLLKINPQITNPKRLLPGEKIYLNNIKRSTASEEQISEEIVKPHNQNDLLTVAENTSWLTYHLLLGATYNALNSVEKSNNAEAYIYSNLSPKLEVGMVFNWDKNTQTGFILSGNFYDFNLSGSLSLDKSTAYESKFSFYYQKQMDDFVFKFSLAANNELLLKNKTLSTLELVNTISPEVELGFSYILRKNKKMQLSFGIEGGGLIPFDNNDLQYTDGIFYKGLIDQTYRDKKASYGAKFYYLQKDLETKEIEVIRKQLGLDLYWQY